jgi:integrase
MRGQRKTRKNGKSLVRPRPDSPHLWTDFSVGGKRIRENTGTDEWDEAELIASQRRNDLLRALRNERNGQSATVGPRDPNGKRDEMRLDEACAKYWDEHGRHLSSSDRIKLGCRLLIKGLGASTFLSAITSRMVADHLAARKAGRLVPDPPNNDPKTVARYKKREGVELSNGRVDDDRILLRAIINRADDVWEVAIPKIKWGKLKLLHEKRQRILTYLEQERLMAALRLELLGVVELALATGLRRANVMHIKWTQVDWEGKRLAFRIKSKEPGGEFHYLHMTPEIEEILKRHLGHHSVYVFTYVCKANTNVMGKYWRYEGKRYPFSEGGWRKDWYRALMAVGLWNGKGKPDNFRFHDLRHTAATRTLDATDDIYLVMDFLGHADIRSTVRYAKLGTNKLKDGMEATSKLVSQNLSRVRRMERKIEGDSHI